MSDWREGQWEAIQQSRASQRRFVAHSMPTGGGKSGVLLGEARATNKRTLLLTSTKALQSQYEKEFKATNIVDIQGKSNYKCRATELGGEWFMSGSPPKSVAHGPCQFGADCSLRSMGCTYYDKVRQVSNPSTKLVQSNYSAWISSNLYTDGWGKFDLICADEAHEAERWLVNTLSIEFSTSFEKLLDVPFPTQDSPAKWVQWAAKVLPSVRLELRQSREQVRSSRSAKGRIRILSLQHAERLLVRMRGMTEDWLVIPQKDHILFCPVWVQKYAEPLLFAGADKVVFASATITPYELRLLGVGSDDCDFFQYKSTFPPERRPVYYYPVVKMRYGMDAEENLEWINVMDDFISSRLDRKGIIPTVSFARAKQIMACSKYASLMVASTGSQTSIATMQKFRLLPPPAILVGPNFGTGTDLPYKQAEYCIIPKVPFENIMEPLNVARSAEDPNYGFHQAAKKLVQYIGRIVRANDDSGENIILDRNFDIFMKGKFRKMIPEWVWDVVQVVDQLPPPLQKL